MNIYIYIYIYIYINIYSFCTTYFKNSHYYFIALRGQIYIPNWVLCGAFFGPKKNFQPHF